MPGALEGAFANEASLVSSFMNLHVNPPPRDKEVTQVCEQRLHSGIELGAKSWKIRRHFFRSQPTRQCRVKRQRRNGKNERRIRWERCLRRVLEKIPQGMVKWCVGSKQMRTCRSLLDSITRLPRGDFATAVSETWRESGTDFRGLGSVDRLKGSWYFDSNPSRRVPGKGRRSRVL